MRREDILSVKRSHAKRFLFSEKSCFYLNLYTVLILRIG